MAPLVAAAASNPELIKALRPEPSVMNNMFNKVFGVVVVGGLAYGGWRLWRKYKEKEAEDEASKTPEGQTATKLYQAFNPSGIPWFKAFDMTATQAVLECAKTIKDFAKVSALYNDIYHDDLTKRLQSELNAADLAEFYKRMNSNPDNPAYAETKAGKVKKGLYVITAKEVYLRRQPEKKTNFLTNKASNATALLKSGICIGTATGKTERDDAANIMFVQVEVANAYADYPKKRYLWAALQHCGTSTTNPTGGQYIQTKPDYSNESAQQNIYNQ